METKLTIAVVHGGTSSERAVSTVNAGHIARGLKTNGHTVFLVEFDETIGQKLMGMRPDLVFIAVQGKAHGDGKLQSICEGLELPYTGSKAVAAAIINHKGICKEQCINSGLPTPEFINLTKEHFLTMPVEELLARIEKVMPYPVLAKAVSQGGGFGIEYIYCREDIAKVADAFLFDDEIIIERFIDGDLATSAVLEIDGIPTVLPVFTLRLEGHGQNPIELYNNSIYTNRVTVSDDALSPAQQATIEKISREAFLLFKAHNYARIDFMLERATGKAFFIEINAIPGLIENDSFFPRAAERFGLSFCDLLEIIVENELQGGVEQCAI